MRKPRTAAVFLILSAGLAMYGCDKGEETGGKDAPPLDSLEQTLWEGTLTDSDGTVISLSVAFRSENHGYYVLEGNSFWFTYYSGSNKLINISGDPSYTDNILAGEWVVFQEDTTGVDP